MGRYFRNQKKPAAKKRQAVPERKRRLRELAGDIGIYLMLDAAVSFLFYRSWTAFAILFPGLFVFRRMMEKERLEKRSSLMRQQFLSAMQLVSVSMQAGYVPENAFRDAFEELKRMYGDHAPVVEAFAQIRAGMELNRPLEELLTEMGEQSGVDDIQSFAEIFVTVRRSGADMLRIIRNTAESIRRKEETLREIESVLAGKQLEQRMMSVIPLFILGYVSLTSPGFLDVMYHNLTGVIVMSVSLAVYAVSVVWTGKIMHITI